MLICTRVWYFPCQSYEKKFQIDSYIYIHIILDLLDKYVLKIFIS